MGPVDGIRYPARMSESAPVSYAQRFRGFLPVVVDVETGGFDSDRDALLEIAAVIIRMDAEGFMHPEPVVSTHVVPFPGANIDPRALEITGIDPTLARAAATLGASPWEQFRQIYLPLLAPGLAITFCLAFVQAFSVFPSAVLVGAPSGSTRVISLAAYEAAFEEYDYSMAAAVAMVMGFAQLAVVIFVMSVRQAFYRGPASSGKG